jgi:hypothetical protein
MAENLNEKVKELDEKLKILTEMEGKKKAKMLDKFLKINAGKVKRGNIPVLYLRSSGLAELNYVPVTDGWYEINGNFYKEEPKSYWIFGKKKLPLVLIPEWAIKPICRDDLFEKDVAINNTQEDVSYAVKAIEYAEMKKIEDEQGIKKKTKMNPKVLLLILVLVVGGFVLFQKFKGGG